MKRIKILVWLEWPEKCFRVDTGALRRLKELAPEGTSIVRVRTERAFLRELPNATHALVWNFKGTWFAYAPHLRMLATPSAGQELLPTTGPKGVKIHFGGFHGRFMAESVLAFVFAWARGFFRPELRNSAWPRTELSDKCYTVAGTRAVIAGFGHVGRAIGCALEANGVTVTGYTRHGLFEGARSPERIAAFSPVPRPSSPVPRPLSSALAHADWLILALPSTTGTDNFLDAKLLAKLPRTCVVVNVGRGNAVDERALCRALKSRRIAGAYLDVRCHEPTAVELEKPGFVSQLSELDNCIVMPHASAFDASYLTAFIEELAKEGLLR